VSIIFYCCSPYADDSFCSSGASIVIGMPRSWACVLNYLPGQQDSRFLFHFLLLVWREASFALLIQFRSNPFCARAQEIVPSPPFHSLSILAFHRFFFVSYFLFFFLRHTLSGRKLCNLVVSSSHDVFGPQPRFTATNCPDWQLKLTLPPRGVRFDGRTDGASPRASDQESHQSNYTFEPEDQLCRADFPN